MAVVRTAFAKTQKNPDPEGPVRPTDKEYEAMLRSVTGKEQGPNTQQQSFVNWRELADQLGQPFDVERIPVSKLRQMRRDPMLGFGLHYMKTPLVRAPWRIVAEDRQGPNAQIAAFVDAVLRPIYADLIFKYCMSLDFGFQAMTKRFKFEFPSATFRDTTEGQDAGLKPVWSEGNVPAVTLKHFVTLEPEKVQPVWKKTTGEFDGINYDNQDAATLGGAGFRQAQNDPNKANVDIYHSLWATNEKASVFGSLFGYPRVAYAYRYWWSFWFRWALYDRYIERMAIPPATVYYPEGKFTDPETDDEYDNQDIAINAADAIRSGGLAALPSDPVEGMGREGIQTMNMRKWEIAFVKGGEMNLDFAKEFAQLDVMKLRALWIPEQAFLEGEGGTSSRNVASQMAEIFIQSQTNLMAEIDDHINRFVIPQLVVINFPEFEGTARKVTTGFAQEDVDFLKQIIQLIGQSNPAELGVDVPTAMERLGLPVLTPEQRREQEARLVEQSPLTTPATAEPAPGGTVVPTPDNQALFGWSYVNPPEQIVLSDDEDFVADLPGIIPFEDKQSIRTTIRMRKLWKTYYSGLYKDFAEFLLSQQIKELKDEDSVELAGLSRQEAREVAKRVVDKWKTPATVAKTMLDATQNLIKTIIDRASRVEADRINTRGNIDDEQAEQDAAERATFAMNKTEDTTRAELQDYLATQMELGRSLQDITSDFEDHFRDFPKWKSNRVARAEAQDAYNTGTLLAGIAAGVKVVQASDASDGQDFNTDTDCIDRHGNIYPIEQAVKDVRPHHPNCTLFFRLVPPRSNINFEELPEEADQLLADYDEETGTLYLADDISEEDATRFKFALVDKLVEDAQNEND